MRTTVKITLSLLALACVDGAVLTEANADVLCMRGDSVKIYPGKKCRDGSKRINYGNIGIVSPVTQPGPQGEQGPAGAQGAQGEQGTAGPQGAQGPQGEQGPQGPQGEVGAAGLKGDKGDPGEVGPQGAQGEKGDKGGRGDVGPQGVAGPKGDVGPKGARGADGSAVSFSKDVLMTCKSYSFTSNFRSKGTTDRFGRSIGAATARCGANQILLNGSAALQAASPDAQVSSQIVMRDIVRRPMNNTTDFTVAAQGAPAIPSGLKLDFFDSNANNSLSVQLICCTLDVNETEGTPTIE